MKTTSLEHHSWAVAHRLVAGAIVNFSFLAVLIILACLREQPSFWTNAGDWPIWLRELVETSFFPLLLLELLLLIVFSWVCIRLVSLGRSSTASPAVAVLPLLWALFLLVVAILAANNLENLLAGRRLHWHPG